MTIVNHTLCGSQKRTNAQTKGTAGESRCRKAKGLNGVPAPHGSWLPMHSCSPFYVPYCAQKKGGFFMAGKKTGKRLLTCVLVLVMALSLLPLNALARSCPFAYGPAPLWLPCMCGEYEH